MNREASDAKLQLYLLTANLVLETSGVVLDLARFTTGLL